MHNIVLKDVKFIKTQTTFVIELKFIKPIFLTVIYSFCKIMANEYCILKKIIEWMVLMIKKTWFYQKSNCFYFLVKVTLLVLAEH